MNLTLYFGIGDLQNVINVLKIHACSSYSQCFSHSRCEIPKLIARQINLQSKQVTVKLCFIRSVLNQHTGEHRRILGRVDT